MVFRNVIGVIYPYHKMLTKLLRLIGYSHRVPELNELCKMVLFDLHSHIM